MIDLSKLVFHSGYPNFAFASKGHHDFPVTTSYTSSASTTTVLTTGIDPASQYVMVFFTNDLAREEVTYDDGPVFYERIIEEFGSPLFDEAFIDFYYYVSQAGELVVKTFNFLNPPYGPGTYPILDDNEFRAVWYVIDMIP